MPGYLAGAPRITGHQSRHISFSLTGREIIIGIIVLAAFVLILAIPVWWGAGFESFSRSMAKAARPTFLFGLGVLVFGLASGVRIIQISGGAVMAATVIGVIAEHYLNPGPTSCITGPGLLVTPQRSRSRDAGTTGAVTIRAGMGTRQLRDLRAASPGSCGTSARRALASSGSPVTHGANDIAGTRAPSRWSLVL